jgi:TonB-linked SusC/RagA family outer membrane protein
MENGSIKTITRCSQLNSEAGKINIFSTALAMNIPNSFKSLNRTLCIKARFIAVLIIASCLLSISQVYGQQKKIVVKGFVSYQNSDESIPGVTVLIDNKTPVGSTDAKGAYTVNVPIDARLTFHYVGCTDVIMDLSKNADKLDKLNVKMTEKSSALSEVVVRGYAAKTRETESGSSVVISGKDIQDVPVSSVEQLLQGRVAGLDIQVNTGAPGYRGSTLVRGLSNIDVVGSGEEAYLNPTSPLYVVDGIPIDADDQAATNGFNSLGPGISPLSMIAPEDIQSIEVLKDAEATSAYGSRGAYGVILITTKKGNSPTPRVRYSTNFFVNVPPKLRSTLGGTAERQFKVNQILKYGSPSDIVLLGQTNFLSDSLSAYYNNTTNWQDIFYGITYNQTHNLSIDGGDKTFNYKTNIGYYSENGIVTNTGFSRYTLNTNFTYTPTPKFSVYANVYGGYGIKNKGNGVGLLQNGIAKNTSASSLLPPPSLYLATSDVLGALDVKNNNNSKNLRTSFQVNYQILPKLNINSTASYDATTGIEDTYTPAIANGQYSKAYAYNEEKYTIYNRNSISYAKIFGKAHEFNISGFNEIYIRSFQSYAAENTRLPVDTYIGPIGYSGDFVTGSSRGGGMVQYTKSKAASFNGSFSYNFKKKYVFNFNYRFDGNSFSGGDDNQFSSNPSVGARWNFNKEKFFLNNWKWLDYGSLRLTWGKSTTPTGNVFSVNGTLVNRGNYNGQPTVGYSYTNSDGSSALPNPDLGSATSETYNLGTDLGMFNGRVNIVFDTYLRRMSRQTRALDLPTIIGFTRVLSNQVSIINYGYESSISVAVLRAPHKFTWQTSLVGALNFSFLTKLPGGVNQIITDNTVFKVGRNSLSNYLFRNDGVFSTTKNVPVDPVTGLRLRNNTNTSAFFQGGDPIFYDLDGDYVITDKDRMVLGNSQPLLTGGLSNIFTFGSNWSLVTNSSFTFKRDIINASDANRLRLSMDPFGTQTGNGPQAVIPVTDLNYWQKPGDIARYPDPYNYTRYNVINPFRTNQSLFQESGTYFKINYVTLSYTFPKQLATRFGIRSLRVYTTVNNVITFSPYSGANAENVSSLGYDNSGGYPIARTYSLGLNLEL